MGMEMAQGLDSISWNGDKSPSMDRKSGETVKRTRGVGSRRIFPPQFKLQVLDSYRNDVDCRGNQRATARKYNIHRRQIQKWLQCEQNLRISVEDSAKGDATESNCQKPRRKSDWESQADMTLNKSTTKYQEPELVEESSPLSPKQENKIDREGESKLDLENLKRVAQKLYPSLQGVSCGQERVTHSGASDDGRKFCRGDFSYEFRFPPSPSDLRDDNFNKVIRTDDGPLNLKSKVRSEILPEKYFDSNAEGGWTNENSPKLRIREESELASPNENVIGQKLSVSNSVLKCLVQKYADDVGGQEFHAVDAERSELLCSHDLNRTESSCLSDIGVPKKTNSVPYLSSNFHVKRSLDEEEESSDLASDLNLSTDGDDTCRKKQKIEDRPKLSSLFDSSKSFSPKRKWIKESMQEMLEDAEHSQDTSSSLPIKQRVKMNLRSLSEAAAYTSDVCGRQGGLSSNFTIERLCSTDSPKSGEFGECQDFHSTRDSAPQHSLQPSLLPTLSPSAFHQHSTDVPLKEEKVSDDEDVDVDILSTTPVDKKTFEFSGFNFGKRRSFSVQFKLTVLDAFYNDKDCNKNQRATARKFNINRRQVQKWLSQESELRSEGSFKNGKYLQRQRLGGDTRDVDGCARCPQHCLRRKPQIPAFDKTIQVNVKPCSDNYCLSRRENLSPDDPKTDVGEGVHFYGKHFFENDLKTTSFYHNYLFPDNGSMIYHDSILGWPTLNPSALTVPNFQYLSTWHRNIDFCSENQKIC